MDSTAQTNHRDLDIIKELLSRVAYGFDSLNSPYGSDIINELLSRVPQVFDSPKSLQALRYQQRTGVTGDAWIRHPKEPLSTQISQTN